MVLGVIYGFVWAWGPIICGLLGLAGGFLVGFLLDISFTKLSIPNKDAMIRMPSYFSWCIVIRIKWKR